MRSEDYLPLDLLNSLAQSLPREIHVPVLLPMWPCHLETKWHWRGWAFFFLLMCFLQYLPQLQTSADSGCAWQSLVLWQSVSLSPSCTAEHPGKLLLPHHGLICFPGHFSCLHNRTHLPGITFASPNHFHFTNETTYPTIILSFNREIFLPPTLDVDATYLHYSVTVYSPVSAFSFVLNWKWYPSPVSPWLELHCSSDTFISSCSGFVIIPHWVFSLPLVFIPWQNNKSLSFTVSFLSLLSFSLSHSFLVSIIKTLQQGLLSANPEFVLWVCLCRMSGVFLSMVSLSSNFLKLFSLGNGACISCKLTLYFKCLVCALSTSEISPVQLAAQLWVKLCLWRDLRQLLFSFFYIFSKFVAVGKKTAGLYPVPKLQVTLQGMPGAAPRNRRDGVMGMSFPMCQAASGAAVLVSFLDSVWKTECLCLGWRWHQLPSCVWFNIAAYTCLCTHISTFITKLFLF